MSKKQSQATDGATETANTPRRPGALSKLSHIRAEMSAVYRDARQERIKSSEASRLVYILRQIADVLVEETMEERVTRLEERFGA